MNDQKLIPAGSGEKMQYVAHLFNDHTMRFVLRFPGQLDPEILRDTMLPLVSSVDILHASFIPNAFGAKWHIHDDICAEDCFAACRCEGDPLSAADPYLKQPIPHTARAQMRCSLLQGKDSCAVVLAISHLCVDGGDGKYLLRKLAEAYTLIKRTGSADGLRIKNGDRSAEQVYAHLSRKEVRSQMKQPGTPKTLFPFAEPDDSARRPQILHSAVSAEIMSKARQRAKAANATANDVILTAGYRAYAGLPGVQKDAAMAISSMMDVRKYCPGGDSAGLSNVSGLFPTQLERGVSGSFEDTLLQIVAQTCAIKQDPLGGLVGLPLLHAAIRTLPMALLLKGAPAVYKIMSISMTNLGNLRFEDHAFGGLVPNDGLLICPIKKMPSVQAGVMSFGGHCRFSCAIECSDSEAAQIQVWLDGISSQIIEYAK